MDTLEHSMASFFGVALKGQTYLNTLYLLLSFPLGLFYFIFLVVGLSLGFGLLILWIGLFILLAVFAIWYGLTAFERKMAIVMLREEIPPLTNRNLSGMSLWQKFTATISNPVTWKGLVYLIAKFPLGIFSFCVLVTLISLSASLIALPFYYQYIEAHGTFTLNGIQYYPLWVIDTMPKASIACIVGILIALISLHAFNGLAWVSGKFARVMLGNFNPSPSQPIVSEVKPAAPATLIQAQRPIAEEIPTAQPQTETGMPANTPSSDEPSADEPSPDA